MSVLSLCSKIGCVVKNAISDIKNKNNITSATADDADMLENSTSDQNHENTVEDDHIKLPSVEVTIKNSKYEFAHGSRFKNGQPRWIVVHYTACAGVSAKNMCKSMSRVKDASSHFYIDSKDIYASVPLEYIAWHVGNGKVKQPSGKDLTLEELSTLKASDWRYDLAASNHLKWISEDEDFLGNSVSIGVDFCVLKKSTITKKATDTDWYFNPDAVENVAKTVAYLMKKYNIDLDHVIRHGDATGKPCPRPLISILPDEDNDSEWEKFKEKVSEYRECGVIAKWV